jgi:hypothetical protein
MLKKILLPILFLFSCFVIFGAATAADSKNTQTNISSTSIVSEKSVSTISFSDSNARSVAFKFMKVKGVTGYSGLYPYKRTSSNAPYLYHITTNDKDPNKRISYYGVIIYKIGDIEVNKYGYKVGETIIKKYVGKYQTFYYSSQIRVHINLNGPTGQYSEDFKYYTPYTEVTNLKKWSSLKKIAIPQIPNSYQFTYYRQIPSNYCGPTSLKMVLSFYKQNINVKTLAAMAHTSVTGTTHTGLINAVKQVNNLKNTSFTARDESFKSWSTLYNNYLSKNVPLILTIRSYEVNLGHYVVLTGINLTKKTAIIADPAYGYRTVTLTDLGERMNWIVSRGTTRPIIVIK